MDGKHNSLAASVNVAPNMIDFSSVWGKFTNIGENAVVFSVVLGTLVLYILLLLWARRKDKLDKVKVGVFGMYNNHFFQRTLSKVAQP